MIPSGIASLRAAVADSVDCESTWLAEQGNETGTVLPIYLLRLSGVATGGGGRGAIAPPPLALKNGKFGNLPSGGK